MDIRHLHAFLAVADHLHFRQAARQVAISQPALSRTIKQLEGELGVELFDRTSRQVSLTPAGEAFLVRAKRAMLEMDAGREDAQQASLGRVGSLHVAHASQSIATTLPCVMKSFMEAHPLVNVQLSTMSSTAQVEALRAGAVDVGVMTWPEERFGLELMAIHISQHLAIAMSSEHALAQAESVSFSELRDEVHLVLPRAQEPRIYDAWMQASGKSEGHDVRHVEVEHIATMMALVLHGAGVAYAPSGVASLCPKGVTLVPVSPRIPVDFGVMVREGESDVMVRAFAQSLCDAQRE